MQNISQENTCSNCQTCGFFLTTKLTKCSADFGVPKPRHAWKAHVAISPPAPGWGYFERSAPRRHGQVATRCGWLLTDRQKRSSHLLQGSQVNIPVLFTAHVQGLKSAKWTRFLTLKLTKWVWNMYGWICTSAISFWHWKFRICWNRNIFIISFQVSIFGLNNLDGCFHHLLWIYHHFTITWNTIAETPFRNAVPKRRSKPLRWRRGCHVGCPHTWSWSDRSALATTWHPGARASKKNPVRQKLKLIAVA